MNSIDLDNFDIDKIDQYFDQIRNEIFGVKDESIPTNASQSNNENASDVPETLIEPVETSTTNTENNVNTLTRPQVLLDDVRKERVKQKKKRPPSAVFLKQVILSPNEEEVTSDKQETDANVVVETTPTSEESVEFEAKPSIDVDAENNPNSEHATDNPEADIPVVERKVRNNMVNLFSPALLGDLRKTLTEKNERKSVTVIETNITKTHTTNETVEKPPWMKELMRKRSFKHLEGNNDAEESTTTNKNDEKATNETEHNTKAHSETELSDELKTIPPQTEELIRRKNSTISDAATCNSYQQNITDNSSIKNSEQTKTQQLQELTVIHTQNTPNELNNIIKEPIIKDDCNLEISKPSLLSSRTSGEIKRTVTYSSKKDGEKPKTITMTENIKYETPEDTPNQSPTSPTATVKFEIVSAKTENEELESLKSNDRNSFRQSIETFSLANNTQVKQEYVSTSTETKIVNTESTEEVRRVNNNFANSFLSRMENLEKPQWMKNLLKKKIISKEISTPEEEK